jgi:hypothetical protein
LCPIENPSKSLSMGNLNPKDVGLAMHKSFITMLEPRQEG